MLGGSTERNGRSEEDERLDPDRPHFPEATTTVGIGRAILDSGYTFTKKGGSFVSHSYPEALLRIGMLADWFEFRVGQNVVSQQESIPGERRRTRSEHKISIWELSWLLANKKDGFPPL